LVGLCSLNTQEAKVVREEPKQKTKKEKQMSFDEVRL